MNKAVSNVEAGEIRVLSLQNNEPVWLTDSRLQALKLAAALELPKLEKTRLERWDIHEYGTYAPEQDWNSLKEAPEAVRELVAGQGGREEGGLIVQRNSDNVYAWLAPEFAAQGVVFTDLQTAAREHGELVKPYLHQAVSPEEHVLAAQHAALWSGGVFLYVPDNVEVTVPLQAIFLNDRELTLFAPHILIVTGRNSSVSYVDNYLTGGNSVKSLHNGGVEVFVGVGSQVRFASVHQLGPAATDLTWRRAVAENDGSIEWIIGEMNEGNTASETKTVLKGDGSFSDAKVIAVGSASQKLSYTTQAQHYGKSSKSQMATRAVMREEATAIINGITKIEKGASKCDGQQAEKVLMLSPMARGDANPILLIDEDDVVAGHAASVGQVNPEQIYYLMSRGISRRDAEYLVIFGFLAPVISEIPLEGVRERLQRLVERKLGRTENGVPQPERQ